MERGMGKYDCCGEEWREPFDFAIVSLSSTLWLSQSILS